MARLKWCSSCFGRSVGLEGLGTIVSTATAVGEGIEVVYSYTDMFVLSVLWSNIHKKPKPQQRGTRACRYNDVQKVEADFEYTKSNRCRTRRDVLRIQVSS